MRSICENCNSKNDCSYIRRRRTSECIDVQGFDSGYEAAIQDAKEFLVEAMNNGQLETGNIEKLQESVEEYLYKKIEVEL